jgi:hypothetical protein
MRSPRTSHLVDLGCLSSFLGVFLKVKGVHFPKPFFIVAAKRGERAEMVLTSNPSFTHWTGAFADDQTLTAAMLDRLMNHGHIAAARAAG